MTSSPAVPFRNRLTRRLQPIALLGALSAGFASTAMAEYRSYPLPAPRDAVVGQLLQYSAQQEDTLLDIARRFSLGHDEIIQANPQVDKWLPGKGTPVLLPAQFILPRGPRQGIILNAPEMRLYYFPPPGKGLGQQVITYPVSIGRMDWNTPIGMTRVVRKDKDPAWYPPPPSRRSMPSAATSCPISSRQAPTIRLANMRCDSASAVI